MLLQSVVSRMADEADPAGVLAANNVGLRAAYRPASHGAMRQLGSTDNEMSHIGP